MLKAIEQMKFFNERLTFSTGMDGTKVPQSLNTSNAHKCTMGGTYPNHTINAINVGNECASEMIENKEKPIALAQEVKSATTCAQNHRKGSSPMAAIAARPQGVNAVSTFT